jgi:hypothetical protein
MADRKRNMISKALRQIAGGNVSRSEALILLKQADSNATVIVWHDPEGVFAGGMPNVLVNDQTLSLAEWDRLQHQYKKMCDVIEIVWEEVEGPVNMVKEQEEKNPF